jgi:hypothetical protein
MLKRSLSETEKKHISELERETKIEWNTFRESWSGILGIWKDRRLLLEDRIKWERERKK